MAAAIECSGITHIGRVRERNEDHFLIARLAKTLSVVDSSVAFSESGRFDDSVGGTLCVVADGMGGRAAGECASRLAVHAVADHVLNLLPWFYGLHEEADRGWNEELKTILSRVQDRLFEHTESHPRDAGMGTTLTIAYVVGAHAYVVHAGDSRCYLLRGNKLVQITQDQTVAQAYVDRGIISEEEAAESPFRHVLWNVVAGDSSKLFPSAYHVPLRAHDTLLLCTDGLTRHVSDDEILEAMERPLDSRGVCQSLIEAAIAGGGHDNITVVVARANNELESDERLAIDQSDRSVDATADTAIEIVIPATPARTEKRA